MATDQSSAPANPSSEASEMLPRPDDTIEAHYAGLERLEDHYRHELLDDDERQELRDRILSRRRTTSEGRLMGGLSAENSKAGRLQRAGLELVSEHEADGALPTSNHFVFYELEGRGIVPKEYRDADGKRKSRTPAQDVSDALTRLRELAEPLEDLSEP